MQNLSIEELSERTLRRATSHLVSGILAVRGRPKGHYALWGLGKHDRLSVLSRVKERLHEAGYRVTECDAIQSALADVLGAH